MTAPPSSASLPKKRKLSSSSDRDDNGNSTTTTSAAVPNNSNIKLEQNDTSTTDQDNVKPAAAKAPIHESRLPSKKRKGSHDSIIDNNNNNNNRRRSGSVDAATARRKDSHDSTSAASATLKRRKGSQDSSVQFADTVKDPERKGSIDYSAEAALLHGQPQPRKSSNDLSVQFEDVLAAGRKLSNDMSLSMPSLPSVTNSRNKESADSSSLKIDELLGMPSNPNAQPQQVTSGDAASLPDLLPAPVNAMEHLETLEKSTKDMTALGTAAAALAGGGSSRKDEDDNHSQQSSATYGSSGNRLLVEALAGGSGIAAQLEAMKPRGRDRLESWGGMSDLSMPVGSDAALSLSRFQQKPEEEDGKQLPIAGTRERRNSLTLGRPRQDSLGDHFIRSRSNTLGSLADLSFSGLSATENLETSGINHAELIAAKVAASFGDKLEELATDIETAAQEADPETLRAMRREMGVESDAESMGYPLIGAISDGGKPRGRLRSLSVSSGHLSVDLDAVKDAVSATAGLDMSKIVPTRVASSSSTAETLTMTSKERARKRRQLPMRSRANSEFSTLSDTHSLEDGDKERLVERARRAGTTSSVPFKKRGKRPQPDAGNALPAGNNAQMNPGAADSSALPSAVAPPDENKRSGASRNSKSQATQKWESMYECLLQFIQDKRQEATTGLADSDVAAWQWDGNVPTSFVTSDGKKLGRWVNNQRSSFTKGTLKDDRSERLRDAGLKWSVLTSNSWNEMLGELRKYIEEQTASGKPWDGNVPTNYIIKPRPGSKFNGEDKNLGRWINRQRSLYHAGKLRKDRQDDLDAIGLKWSMLATHSWDVMFETLREYATARKKESGGWDGNVPANFKTNDVPPRGLGRWVNRQRTAYTKSNLKPEHFEKLSAMGLKWSVHERDVQSAPRPMAPVSNPAVAPPIPPTANNNKVVQRTQSVPVETLSLDDDSPVGPAVAAGQG